MFLIKLRKWGDSKYIAETDIEVLDTIGVHAIIEPTKELALEKLLSDLACFIGVESKDNVEYKLVEKINV